MAAVETTLGSFLISSLVESIFFGIVTVQAYSFYIVYGRSSMPLFSLVTVVTMANLLNTLCSCLSIYNWVVLNYDEPNSLRFAPIAFAYQPTISALVGFVVQMYFIDRIYKLARSRHRGISKAISIAMIAIALCVLCCGIIVTYKIFKEEREFARFSEFAWAFETGVILGAMNDVLLTSALIYYLKTMDTTYAQTTNIIDSILRTTIESNAMTAIAAIMMLILFETRSHTFLWFTMPLNVSPKLFANSLLLALNSREPPTRVTRNPTSNKRINTQGNTFTPTVMVTIEQQIDVDDERRGGPHHNSDRQKWRPNHVV